MTVIINNCLKYVDGSFIKIDKEQLNLFDGSGATFSISDSVILPAFCDVHVHLREPGFFYKETIKTGTEAAAHGGYSDIFPMPNLNPVPDCLDNLKKELDIIEKDAVIRVHPYAAATVGELGEELSDMDEMAPYISGFSDDGRGIQSREMMKKAMLKAKSLNKVLAAHCEDNKLLFGGYIHDGKYAKSHNHKGICSESEWGPVKRDIELVRETGCKYHVCHVSSKETVELIRQAKKDGVNITCETGPHYLTMDDSFLKEDGKFKMNPPLRSREDRLALIEGIKDGTIDVIATDHAPHSKEEKSRGLEKSAFGIVGLETAFSVLYTYLVKEGVITLEKLIELMSVNPRKRFGLNLNDNDFTIWNLNKQWKVDPEQFFSKGKSTPYEGQKLYGKCLMTVCDNKVAYINK